MAAHWIAKSIKPGHKGRFKAKAQAAGMTTEAFARKHEHDSGTLGAEAREALTLMGLPHHKSKRDAQAHKLYG